ncbi:MAG: hypothetical protein WD401_01030, partial [Thermomicrobiaceae bacterium]
NSVRSALSFEQASEFSVQPVALLQLILPTVFGSNPTDYWGAFSSGEIWGYVGVSTLVVAAIGLVLRPTAHRIFFAALAVLALIYALGPAVPVHGWFYQFVPGFDLIRAPARAYLFLNLSLAVLAGLAISDLSRRIFNPGFGIQHVLGRGIRFLLVVIGASTLIIIPFFYTRILGVNDPPNRPVITVENLWMMVLFLSLLLGVFWLARTGTVRGSMLGLILAAVLLLDLFSVTMPFNPSEEDLVSGYRDPEVARFLEEEWAARGPFRIDVRHPGLLPNFGMTSGIHNANGVYDPMQPAAYATLHNLLQEQPEALSYNMLNVRYWVAPPDEQAPDGFEQVFQSGTGNQVWEHADSLPRAWFVSVVLDVAHGAQGEEVRASGFDPSESVLIQSPPLNADGTSAGEAEIRSYSPERIEIAVDADGPGYVVIADGDYPGWSAEIDGEPAEVLTANYGIRAIPVHAQSEQIELTYESGFVVSGFVAAGFGLLILTGMVAWPLLAGRRLAFAADDSDSQD